MPNLILFLILAIYALGEGIVLWAAFRLRPTRETCQADFRLTYVILPLLVFSLSIAITTFFYPRLPSELAYGFKPGASAESHFSRNIAPALMLLPQLLFALPLAGISWGVSRLSREVQSITLERTVLATGNIAALPQLIVCFALADIFSYNSYGSHLVPLWLFGAIVLVSGAAFLRSLFVGAMRHRKPSGSGSLKT